MSRARRRNKRTRRARAASHDENRFEQETRAFFGRVREGYLAIAKREPGRVVMVDARGTPGQTHQKIRGSGAEEVEAVEATARHDTKTQMASENPVTFVAQ